MGTPLPSLASSIFEFHSNFLNHQVFESSNKRFDIQTIQHISKCFQLPHTVVVWSVVSDFLLLSKRYKNHSIYECACHSLWCCCKTSCEIIQIRSSLLSHPISTVLDKKRNTRASQMKTLNIFHLVIYRTQKVHNGFIFLCSHHYMLLFHSLLCSDFPSQWFQLLQCRLVSLMGMPDQVEESLLQN